MNQLKLEALLHELTVCKLPLDAVPDLSKPFYFIGKTDEELSLVCHTQDTPENTVEREDGWKAFRIKGTLDFSLTGILSAIAKVLADNYIGIFAVSTYNTDYVLVKQDQFENALSLLNQAGYEIIR